MKIKSKTVVKRFRAAGFLLPSLIGTAIFTVIPFLIVIMYSLWNNPIQKEFVGIGNYIKLLSNTAFLQAVKNTFTFSIIAVPLAVVLPLLAACVFMNIKWGKAKLQACLISPVMVPTASIILVWQALFGYNGMANEILVKFGYSSVDWFKSSSGVFAIVLLFLWKNLGYNMIMFLAALANVPIEVVEAAQVDGANRIKVFLIIKLRYIAPSIVFVTLLSIINSFKIFREIYLLTGDYPHESLYMLQHYMNNTFTTLDYQKMSTAAVLIAAILFIIVGVLLLLERVMGRDLEA